MNDLFPKIKALSVEVDTKSGREEAHVDKHILILIEK